MTEITNVLAAANHGSLNILCELLNNGGDPNQHESAEAWNNCYRDWGVAASYVHGETALLKAIKRGFVKTAKTLISFGADVNLGSSKESSYRYHTPIEYAYAYCGEDFANYLISKGATPIEGEKPEFIGPVRTEAQKVWGELEESCAEQRKEFYVAQAILDFTAQAHIAYETFANRGYIEGFYQKFSKKVAELLDIRCLGQAIALPSVLEGKTLALEDVHIVLNFNTADGCVRRGELTNSEKVLAEFRNEAVSRLKANDSEPVLAAWIRKNAPAITWEDEQVREWFEKGNYYEFWYWFDTNISRALNPDYDNINFLEACHKEWEEASRVFKKLSGIVTHHNETYRGQPRNIPCVVKEIERVVNYLCKK